MKLQPPTRRPVTSLPQAKQRLTFNSPSVPQASCRKASQLQLSSHATTWRPCQPKQQSNIYIQPHWLLAYLAINAPHTSARGGASLARAHLHASQGGRYVTAAGVIVGESLHESKHKGGGQYWKGGGALP
jgi:hypothetical protein